jgi:hypothetical protein
MNKHLLTKLVALVMVGFFNTSEATTLSIKFPDNSNVYTTAINSVFDANLYADGLPDFGGFDLYLTYDSTKLSAQSLTSATVFGATTDVSFANSIAPGSIHFAEALSFDALETKTINAPTLLGTIKFKALALTPVGVSYAINISNPAIYTFDGTSLGGTLQGGNVRVTAAPAPVPLPASAFLFVPGLLAVFGIRKNSARKLAA